MYKLLKDPDDGNTLIVAVMVGFIAMALSATAVAAVVSTSRDSGRDRQMMSQVHAAEAGIDNAYYLLQSGELPCGSVLGSEMLKGSPDDTSAATQIRYYTAEGAEVACPVPAGVTPDTAVITATATSANRVGPGRQVSRTLESQVQLAPKTGADGYAMYIDGNLTLQNGFHLRKTGNSSPDIYADNGFTCENTATGEGSVIVPSGDVRLANKCDIGGNVHAAANVFMSTGAKGGQSVVRGHVWSSGGSFTIKNPAEVILDVRVGGSASGDLNQVYGDVFANQENIADPIDRSLPVVEYREEDWLAAGFQTSPLTECADIRQAIFTTTVDTVFYGACQLNLGKLSSANLQADIAVFAEDGITLENDSVIMADAPRKLWLIVPSRAGADPVENWGGIDEEDGDGKKEGKGSNPECTNTQEGALGDNIYIGQRTHFQTPVSVFLYTRSGGVCIGQNTTLTGQVYASAADIGQATDITFVSTPPTGVDLRAHSASPGYDVGVVYKREILP